MLEDDEDSVDIEKVDMCTQTTFSSTETSIQTDKLEESKKTDKIDRAPSAKQTPIK